MASAPLTQPKPKLAARPRHVPLGQLLVEAGVRSEDQLARALAAQKRTQAPLGPVLVRLNSSDEAAVAAQLANHARVPFQALPRGPGDPDGLALVTGRR